MLRVGDCLKDVDITVFLQSTTQCRAFLFIVDVKVSLFVDFVPIRSSLSCKVMESTNDFEATILIVQCMHSREPSKLATYSPGVTAAILHVVNPCNISWEGKRIIDKLFFSLLLL
jgi:hypothetical protein